jgi:hypothetical protein
MIIKFPLLKQVRQDEFWPKCKVLLNEFSKVQLYNYYAPQHTESSMYRKLAQKKIKNSLNFAYCASIKTEQGKEESIRISDSLVMMDEKEKEKEKDVTVGGVIRINIVSVRLVKEKRTLREVSHSEFIVETKFPDKEPLYVARRYEDFCRLRDQLKHRHPRIPVVPQKLRTSEKFYKEQDRIQLRAFLNQLLEHPSISRSKIFRFWLTDDPIMFVPEEDTVGRAEADAARLKEQEQCQEEINQRVKELHSTMEDLKNEITNSGGLMKIFSIIKQTKNIQDLPTPLKKAVEWARINFAFALHKQFVTLDTATENLNNLRQTHRMLPYKPLSLILRLSNPISMVKGVLDLFLAQPFGGKSLFQRILIANMNEESKTLMKSIDKLKEKIDNKDICTKVYNAIQTPRQSPSTEFQSHTEEVLSVLINADIKPMLSQQVLQSLCEDNKETKDLLKHIYQLWEYYGRQKEQDIMMDLVFQGVTSDLLKEFISVFYQPLAQVYKAADISTTIGHIANFVDDLLRTIDDHNLSIQAFIDLVQRHEQMFYDFVYNVHTQEASQVFDELIGYVDSMFTFMAQGIPGKIDMNHCVQEAGIVTPELQEQLMKEIDALCEYRYKQKQYQFERTKTKLMSNPGGGAIEVKEELFSFLPEKSELVEAVKDMDDEDTDELSTDESTQTNSSNHRRYEDIKPPELVLIPKVAPFFMQDMLKLMHPTVIKN